MPTPNFRQGVPDDLRAGPDGEVVAQYDGWCHRCLSSIAKGIHLVVKDPETSRYIHLGCRGRITIAAKFDSRCPGCGEDIMEGDTIVKQDGDVDWVCEDCA